MTPKREKQGSRILAHKEEKGECVIPGAVPFEALADYVLKTGGDEANRIRSYVEWQAPDVPFRTHVTTSF
jgi:hypothetical protein